SWRRSPIARSPSRWRLWWRSWLTRWCRPVLGARIVVEFYEQFLALVSLRGLRPAIDQTPRGFARAVGSELGETLEGEGLRALPVDVTGLYCRVRFGGDTLLPAEVDDLAVRMSRLAAELKPAARSKRSRT